MILRYCYQAEITVCGVQQIILGVNEPRAEKISDAENDALAYCVHGSSESTCKRYTPSGFILAAAYKQGGSYVQVNDLRSSLRCVLNGEVILGDRLSGRVQVPVLVRRCRWTIRRPLSERSAVYVWRIRRELHRTVKSFAFLALELAYFCFFFKKG
jgi:hypothetical protein